MYMYTTNLELRKKAFTVNSQKIKQANGIQEIFILGIKIQKAHFLEKYNYFISWWYVHFQTLLGWNERQGI